MKPPYQKGAADDAEKGLQDFKGKLNPGIGRGAVHIGPAQGIAHHHDDGAHKYRSSHRKETAAFETVAGNIGNGHGLEAVGHKGYEHGQRIKEEIPQKGADAAYQEGPCRVKNQGRRDDDDIVQVQMAAGDREAEGRKGHVHGHEKAAYGKPPRIMRLCITGSGSAAVSWIIIKSPLRFVMV